MGVNTASYFINYLYAMPVAEKHTQADFEVVVWEITETEDFFNERISYRSNANNANKILQQMASRYLLELMHPTFPFNKLHKMDNGKLVLQDSSIDFSLTHTAEYAAAIMSTELKVGIDIEKIDKRVLKVDRKFLNQFELDWLSKLDVDSRIKYTTLCWSIKETVFKWWGTGEIDFANHIEIQDPGMLNQGSLSVNFSKTYLIALPIQYKLIGDHWLTYIAIKHP
jgi:phosphopantetheinyl transferase